MYAETLRTVEGSVMLAIPKPILERLGMHVNQQVEVSISEGRMIVEPKVKPRYTLAELLAQCDSNLPMTSDEREWLELPSVGGEGL